MGHLNPHMILGVLSILEAGLSFNKIPHQSGGVAVANNYMLKMIKKKNTREQRLSEALKRNIKKRKESKNGNNA